MKLGLLWGHLVAKPRHYLPYLIQVLKMLFYRGILQSWLSNRNTLEWFLVSCAP